MSIHVITPRSYSTPGEAEYDNPVSCLNCSTEFDADDHAYLLTEVGLDANGEMQVLCDDCKAGFTCDWCEVTTLEPLNGDLCAKCMWALMIAELEAA